MYHFVNFCISNFTVFSIPEIVLFLLFLCKVLDKVQMYEEMMMNNDNLESNLLTSSFIENA